jgi:DNA-binding transcriptional MerR regulator
MITSFIPEYSNHDEKRKFFSLEIIDTEDQFFRFMSILPKLYDEKKGIWRGLPESRYKLYNSLQRENLITRELKSPKDVIKRINELTEKLTTWNRDVVKRYFYNNHKLQHVPIYAALSILQHYDCKTPLLDWTRNPNVALYFATNSKNEVSVKNKIDNYFSLYLLHKEHPYIKFNSKSGYEFFTSKQIKIVFARIKTFKRWRFSIQEINNYLNDRSNILKDIERFPIQLINDESEDGLTHYLNLNNNINAQDGLFILNADPHLSLEDSIFQRKNDLTKDNSDLKSDIEQASIKNKDNFTCYDIHKKFIPQILKALSSSQINITDSTMFPNFDELKKDISFEKTTVKC